MPWITCAGLLISCCQSVWDSRPPIAFSAAKRVRYSVTSWPSRVTIGDGFHTPPSRWLWKISASHYSVLASPQIKSQEPLTSDIDLRKFDPILRHRNNSVPGTEREYSKSPPRYIEMIVMCRVDKFLQSRLEFVLVLKCPNVNLCLDYIKPP